MKRLVGCLLVGSLMVLPLQKAYGQLVVLDVIKAGVVKAIKAVDLKIQRLQTKTIWLQNAQKVLENKMQQAHLGDITGWVEKQRRLYEDYYEELRNVKQVLHTYHGIKEIISRQKELLLNYREATTALKKDPHFSASDRQYLVRVYSGILEENGKALDALLQTLTSHTTQMSDGERLASLQRSVQTLNKCLEQFRVLHQQTVRLSLQRAKEKAAIQRTKILYGIP